MLATVPNKPQKKSEIETTARVKTRWAALLLTALTLVLMSVIFEPIGWYGAAFVCLVPWAVMVVRAARALRVYVLSVLFGLSFYAWNMRWLFPSTHEGYYALCVYMSLYFLLFAWVLRHAGGRRRIPMTLALPVVWVAGEYFRGIGMTGFPWFFLSHAVYRVLPLIQISDTLGAYGVSFVVALVNGAVCDVALTIWDRRRGVAAEVSSFRRPVLAVVVAIAVIVSDWAYGEFRLDQDTTSPGPRIAVLQGDFLCSAYPNGIPKNEEYTDEAKMKIYFEMLREVSAQSPDLVLLPETPWLMFLNPEVRERLALTASSFAGFQQFAREFKAMIVTGGTTYLETPTDSLSKTRGYNSAYVFGPAGGEPGRYDKVHLVLFGETVPFRFGRFHFIYKWLNSLTPFSGEDGSVEYSMFPGEQFKRFEIKPRSMEASFHFGIPICYEDVMPYVSRTFAAEGGAGKKADFLLNISNDGWFGRGIQQPQHLAICTFRAVENRVGIARAVNTGGSAFIRPTGEIHDAITGDLSHRWPGRAGYAVARVDVDSRFTLYSRWGDWFAVTCGLAALLFLLDAVRTCRRDRSLARAQKTAVRKPVRKP